MVGDSPCLLITNCVPSLPYDRAPLVMLKDLVTAFLSLKSKVWSIPKPGSFGQVVFLVGLQSVHVCARTGARRAEAPTSMVENCIVIDRGDTRSKVGRLVVVVVLLAT